METQEGQEGDLAPRPTSQRVYRSQSIAVHWNPRLCIHSARCVMGLPDVFQPGQRPWVKVDAASAEEIAAVIRRCPTGALHYERLDGGAPEEPDAVTVIAPQRNGPLYVRGRVRIAGPRGETIREDTRVALCRCGSSANKPFCDGSHRRVGFRTPV